ncbi:MAG TPA: dihydropteroate synthase [Nitrospirota bacterium]|nr:dihydropteroate synthase [Nitrospirota bacterium]
MAPVFRISGHGAITVVLHGLTPEESGEIRNALRSVDGGADQKSAPPSFSEQTFRDGATVPVLTGTADQIREASRIIAAYGGRARALAEKISSHLDNYLRSDYKMSCKGTVLDLGSRTHIMGILNVTPDSFSDGGRYADPERALAHARDMVTAGADIIDIGGESTRPGALPLSEEEELRRIIPLIERLSAELSIPLSVDTYKSSVARKALDAGASIVNDISGLRFSPDMAMIAADAGAAVVIMHIKGTPRDMQQKPVYADVIGEISSFLAEGIELAERAGVSREKVLIDPGIGFGKTLEHNLTILGRLEEFRTLGRPIVLGTSRKKFIGTVLGIPGPDHRVLGSMATIALGIERGASVLRVHDVAETVQVARMTDAIMRTTTGFSSSNRGNQ